MMQASIDMTPELKKKKKKYDVVVTKLENMTRLWFEGIKTKQDPSLEHRHIPNPKHNPRT